ncbi:hypothetical protein DFH06DRAFT_1136521 [Mycena polygramma]|nr:hypothetical protein DFH06DRAFT_1136521 [Mycena polygramma]
MSLLINGHPPRTVQKSSTGATVLSAAFVNSIFPGREPGPFVFTINVAPYGNFSCQVDCLVQPSTSDVALGTHWEAFVRDWLIQLGHPVGTAFDGLHFLLDTHHPLSFPGTQKRKDSIEAPSAGHQQKGRTRTGPIENFSADFGRRELTVNPYLSFDHRAAFLPGKVIR